MEGPEALEATARREVREEIGVTLDGETLRYADSSFFVADDGNDVINVVFVAPLPDQARPFPAAPEEVAEILWLTTDEATTNPSCPLWIKRSLVQADRVKAA